jgi:hypothetical protein
MNNLQIDEMNQLIELKKHVLSRNQFKIQLNQIETRFYSKKPEDQSLFFNRLYMIHKPFFLLFFSFICLLINSNLLLPLLNPISFLNQINIIPSNSIRTFYLGMMLMICLFPVIQYLYHSKHKEEITRQIINTYQSHSFIKMILYLIVFYVIVFLSHILRIPLMSIVFDGTTFKENFALFNIGMKYVSIHTLALILTSYLLSFVYIYFIKIFSYINPVFFIPYLFHRLTINRLKPKLIHINNAYETSNQLCQSSRVLKNEDKTIDIIDGVIEYFNDKRINTAQFGAEVYKMEMERLEKYSETINQLSSEVNEKINEINRHLEKNRSEMDKDLNRRARAIYNAQKRIDDSK